MQERVDGDACFEGKKGTCEVSSAGMHKVRVPSNSTACSSHTDMASLKPAVYWSV